MPYIESGLSYRPYKGKDHDRSYLNTGRHIYAVFDGAGSAKASSLAAATLEQVVAVNTDFDVRRAMAAIQARITSDPVIGFHGYTDWTTGTLLHANVTRRRPRVSWAAAGDSPMYTFDHETTQLSPLFPPEDPENFLGTPWHELRQAGHLTVKKTVSYALMSDGVTDSLYESQVPDQVIAKFLGKCSSAQEAADSILHASRALDDATVIVVKINPYE